MNKRDQHRIVNELMKSVKTTLHEKIRYRGFPKEWNGIELRCWVADYFKAQAYVKMSRTRLRDYRNEILVKNLI